MTVYILLAIPCVLPTLVWGFSTGAGDQACINLTPNHDTASQNSTPPYTLIVDTTSIRQGGVVTVTLNATTAGDTFRGFLVQARCTKCTTSDTAIVPGTFAKYTASDNTIQTKNCAGVDQMTMYILLAIACVLPTLVLGYSRGAGKSSCINLTPKHDNTTAQTSTAPYTLTVNTTSIKQGEVVTVTLNATAAGGYFEGFLVQARCTNCTTADTAIVPGTFAKYTASDNTIQTMDCENVTKNAMTHTSEAKQNTTMFTWRAPSDYNVEQGIQFRAVVVKSKLTWWNTVMSDEVGVTSVPSSSSQSVLGMAVVIVSITASLLLYI